MSLNSSSKNAARPHPLGKVRTDMLTRFAQQLIDGGRSVDDVDEMEWVELYEKTKPFSIARIKVKLFY